ncbi:hypothetical protein SSOG_07463 [Streptomyces himastatinicus ATCC 53653]|uniref:Uncharacterized protein n=1 Tax=Streptomyces himastatinicus ATCC 53653 TaxID=457427 RepID=D9WKQ9_9ACTN|nr:hypothetical protein SSOG_07463 [Streptomyces himastatinicus ATCC 53653]
MAVGLTCGGELDVLVQCIDPMAQPHLTAAFEEVLRVDPQLWHRSSTAPMNSSAAPCVSSVPGRWTVR